MNAIDASKGLHRIKCDFQKTYMGQQCDNLLEVLDGAFAATTQLAPVRMQGYFGQARGPRTLNHAEARWEQAMWEQWSARYCQSVPGAWYRIAHYQVNLPHTRADEDWGEIDLVAISHHGLPVVVELKAPGATDSPAAMLVQAAAYALALKKAWHVIAPEWTILIKKYGFDLSFSSTLPICPLVCAAPTSYWNEWTGDSPRAKTANKAVWVSIMRLVLALAERGLPTTFLRLEPAKIDANGFPRDIRAAVIDPFV